MPKEDLGSAHRTDVVAFRFSFDARGLEYSGTGVAHVEMAARNQHRVSGPEETNAAGSFGGWGINSDLNGSLLKSLDQPLGRDQLSLDPVKVILLKTWASE